MQHEVSPSHLHMHAGELPYLLLQNNCWVGMIMQCGVKIWANVCTYVCKISCYWAPCINFAYEPRDNAQHVFYKALHSFISSRQLLLSLIHRQIALPCAIYQLDFASHASMHKLLHGVVKGRMKSLWKSASVVHLELYVITNGMSLLHWVHNCWKGVMFHCSLHEWVLIYLIMAYSIVCTGMCF